MVKNCDQGFENFSCSKLVLQPITNGFVHTTLSLNRVARRLLRPSQQNVSFPIAVPLVNVGRSVGQKKKQERTHEGF